ETNLPRAIYVEFPFIERLKKMLKHASISPHFTYAQNERKKRDVNDDMIRDVMDGQIWKDKAQPLIDQNPETLFLFFLLSNDPVTIDVHFTRSILPYFVKILNFPP